MALKLSTNHRLGAFRRPSLLPQRHQADASDPRGRERLAKSVAQWIGSNPEYRHDIHELARSLGIYTADVAAMSRALVDRATGEDRRRLLAPEEVRLIRTQLALAGISLVDQSDIVDALTDTVSTVLSVDMGTRFSPSYYWDTPWLLLSILPLCDWAKGGVVTRLLRKLGQVTGRWMRRLERLRLGKLIGQGGNMKVYNVVGRPGWVVGIPDMGWVRSVDEWLGEYGALIERQGQLPHDVNVARVLEAGRRPNGTPAILMERAPGKVLHNHKVKDHTEWSHRLAELAAVPQEQFNKLLKDYDVIRGAGLQGDFSKPSNFFYDKQRGFTFIDLAVDTKTPTKQGFAIPMLHTNRLYHFEYRDMLSPSDVSHIREILRRLEKAGDDPNLIKEVRASIDDYVGGLGKPKAPKQPPPIDPNEVW